MKHVDLLFKDTYGDFWRATRVSSLGTSHSLWWYWTRAYNKTGSWVALCFDRHPLLSSSLGTVIDNGARVYYVHQISRLEFLLRIGRSYESTKDIVSLSTNAHGF